MTNLHRIIGYLAATLAELAMAGAFGAAPTFSLYVPTPSATRMSPCPVFASIEMGRHCIPVSGGSNSTTWTNSSGSEYVLDQAISSFSATGSGAASNVKVKQSPEEGDDSYYTEGTVGALAAGEYGVSGGSLYIRLADGSDPDSAAANLLLLEFDMFTDGNGDSPALWNVFWELEYDGSALDNWPAKYRYTTDPRPNLNSRQIDLSGLDKANGNRPKGYNMGWVLTAGTWRVKATVTNAQGESSTVTSSDIVVAADTRTAYTVAASGGDYTTIAAAIAAQAANNNIKITVEDGHTENIGTGGWFSTISGNNFLVQWEGGSTKPLLTYNGSASGAGGNVFTSTGEHTVIDGIDFADSSGGAWAGTLNVDLCDLGDYHACVNMDANVVDFAFVSTTEGMLILNCDITNTYAYSFISAGLLYGGQEQTVMIGSSFGDSFGESCIRFTTNEHYANVLWCKAVEEQAVGGNLKSTFRFGGNFLHRYGCWSQNGTNFMGRVNQGAAPGAHICRVEAEYMNGREGWHCYEDSFDGCYCNNVAVSIVAPTSSSLNADTSRTQRNYHLHNTSIASESHIRWGDDTGNGANRVAANVFKKSGTPARLLTIENGPVAVVNNDFDSDTGSTTFGNINEGGSFDHTVANVAALNAEAFASGNTAGAFTLDSFYASSDPSTVTTEDGVLFDYYGTERAASSWAGAVGSLPPASLTGRYPTVIPGFFIERP